MLYLTRYLTKAHRADYKDELPDGMSALMIPNAEIKEIFETIVIKWFDNSTRKCDRNALFDELCGRLMTECMRRSMRMTTIRYSAMAFRFLRNGVW